MGLAVATVSVTSFTGCIEETEPTTVATEPQIQESASAAEAFLMAIISTISPTMVGIMALVMEQ